MNLARALAARDDAGRPIRVGLVGAGKFGTMILAQLRLMPGVQLCVLADLDAGRARRAAVSAGWSADAFALARDANTSMGERHGARRARRARRERRSRGGVRDRRADRSDRA